MNLNTSKLFQLIFPEGGIGKFLPLNQPFISGKMKKVNFNYKKLTLFS
jgi:hypothetical protein